MPPIKSPKPSKNFVKEEVLKRISEPGLNGQASIHVITTNCRLDGELSMDALAVDAVGRLVIIFFGPKEEKSWILSILDVVSWLDRNELLLRERFSLEKLPKDLPPRVLLVAPNFSGGFLARLGAMRGVDLSPLETRWVELAGERSLTLRPIHLGAPRTGARYPDWALDPKGASFLRAAVEKVSKMDPEIELNWGPSRVHFLFRGKLLALLVSGAQGLRVLTPGGDRSDQIIEDQSQLVRHLDLIYRRYLQSLPESLGNPSPKEEATAFMNNSMGTRFSSGQDLLTQEEVEAISK